MKCFKELRTSNLSDLKMWPIHSCKVKILYVVGQAIIPNSVVFLFFFTLFQSFLNGFFFTKRPTQLDGLGLVSYTICNWHHKMLAHLVSLQCLVLLVTTHFKYLVIEQRTFTVEGAQYGWSPVLLCTNTILPSQVKSNLVKLETSRSFPYKECSLD